MSYAPHAGIGARDLVYALLTSDPAYGGTPVYGSVKTLEGLQSIKINPNSSSAVLYGDDAAREAAETQGDLEIEFNIVDIDPAKYAEIMGHTYSAGVVQNGTTDQSPWIAVGFKVSLSGGVDKYFWFYKGKMRKPSADHSTKNDSINFQTPTFVGSFVALQSNNLRSINVRTDDANALAAFLSGFFSAVALPSADLTALTCVITESAGNILFTFSKGSGASFDIADAMAIQANLPVITSAGLRAGSYAVGSPGTSVVVTFTPTVAFGSGVDVAAYVNANLKDTSGIAATAMGDLLTTA